MNKVDCTYHYSKLFQRVTITLLAALAVITHPHYFATVQYLPDVKLAAFFIVGFIQANHRVFTMLTLFCLTIEVSSRFHIDTFTTDIFLSLPFQVLGYYVLWIFGKTSNYSLHLWNVKQTASFIFTASIALWFASTIAFISSNISFYYFSGLVTHINLFEFIDRIANDFWQYQLNTFIYVVIALFIHIVLIINAHHDSQQYHGELNEK